jgi:replicative DNA helicase
MRAIQSAGVKIAQLGGTHGDLDETRERARQVVDDATRGKHVSKARTVADIMPAVLETAEHGQAATLATGWPDIDRLIGGLAPGRFIVVGASPGGGKSVMGTNLALHVASRHNHAVLLASMEMPEHEVGQRMLAAHARADLTGLAYGRTDEATWTRIGVHLQELMDLPITVDDTPVQTLAHIARAARNLQRKRDDLALIVVDYMQLVRPIDTTVIRSEQVSTIARGLKLLARETGACVVGLAQLNREPSKRSGAPTMTDLREAAIENDADQVILLHCPDADLPEIEAVVAKNRHGPMGVATLQFQGHYARFVSNEWRA